MAPAQVIVVRHGERQDRVNPDYAKTAARPNDSPLTDAGLETSKKLGAYLATNKLSSLEDVVILTSPLVRCVQTADGIVQGMLAANPSVSTVPIAVEPVLAGVGWLPKDGHPPPPPMGKGHPTHGAPPGVPECWETGPEPSCGDEPSMGDGGRGRGRGFFCKMTPPPGMRGKHGPGMMGDSPPFGDPTQPAKGLDKLVKPILYSAEELRDLYSKHIVTDKALSLGDGPDPAVLDGEWSAARFFERCRQGVMQITLLSSLENKTVIVIGHGDTVVMLQGLLTGEEHFCPAPPTNGGAKHPPPPAWGKHGPPPQALTGFTVLKRKDGASPISYVVDGTAMSDEHLK